MDAGPGPLDLLSRALEQCAGYLGYLTPHNRDLPTPDQSWTTGELTAHLLADLENFTLRATGGTPDYDRPTPELAHDPEEQFLEGASRLLGAWAGAGNLHGTVEMPGVGPMPARFPVDQQTTEFAVHAWDLAVAFGQPTDVLDDEIAEMSLAWAKGALRPEFRGAEEEGKAFGPEVTVGEDASAPDRLAAFFGRTPPGN